MISWLLHKLKGDKIIWITVILIGLISMLAIYSSTSALAWRLKGGDTEAFAIRHGIILVAGLLLMYFVHRINYRVYARIVNGMLLVTVLLLIYTIANGAELNEAARWITVMGTSFQPSDLAKLTLMILLAKILTQRQEVIKDFSEGFLPALFWVVIICGLIAPSDLSTALLMFSASVMVMFVAGVDLKYIAVLGIAAVLGVMLLFNTAKRAGTWSSRIHDYAERWTNPDYDGNDQVIQAHVALAKGGVFGTGPGKSTQRNTLPTAYADFIFAIIVEEYGLVGGGIVVLLYMILLFRAVGIVTVSKTFGALLAAGLSFLLVMQALINMGVATGLLPITGFTLPFISMGGTSILFSAITVGIILSVSRDALKPRATSKKLQFS
ncbi:MAG: FtsW/RodA/SpoVE family cell cycle protein [Bacteroidia bacterium]